MLLSKGFRLMDVNIFIFLLQYCFQAFPIRLSIFFEVRSTGEIIWSKQIIMINLTSLLYPNSSINRQSAFLPVKLTECFFQNSCEQFRQYWMPLGYPLFIFISLLSFSSFIFDLLLSQIFLSILMYQQFNAKLLIYESLINHKINANILKLPSLKRSVLNELQSEKLDL